MTELLALRAEVADVLRRRIRLERHPLRDRQAVSLEPRPLRGVVREQSHRAHAQAGEDLRADAVVPLVGREAELGVRLDGVAAFVLEVVRAELVRQPDRASLVAADVEDDAAPFLSDAPERALELLAAVAAERAEHVAGQTLRMNAHEDPLAVSDVTEDHRDVHPGIHLALVREGLEGSFRHRDRRIGDAPYELLAP